VNGWELNGDSCYYFGTKDEDKGVWNTAMELCSNVSAHLIIIDSQSEEDFIRNKIGDNDNVWIGLFRKYISGGTIE